MWYLNQDHAAFAGAPGRRDAAVAALLEHALHAATRFRMEFERAALVKALGPEAGDPALAWLLDATRTAGALDASSGPLRPEQHRTVLRLLSPDLDGRPDLPLNYVEVLELTDARGNAVLRATDSLQFIVFELPSDAHDALLRALAERGVPLDAVEPVDDAPAR